MPRLYAYLQIHLESGRIWLQIREFWSKKELLDQVEHWTALGTCMPAAPHHWAYVALPDLEIPQVGRRVKIWESAA